MRALLLLWLGLARASSLSRVEECLQRFDLGCAQAARDGMVRADPGGAASLRAQAKLAFHEGRYTELQQLMSRLQAQGVSLQEEEGQTPYVATIAAAEGMVAVGDAEVSVRYLPGVDAILAEEAQEVLRAGRKVYAEALGGVPSQTLILDIFPTATRFTGASGLPPESVQTTGVVALSKWTRLLLTSPRALARGYAWKDTVAHEYIHLVVAWRTQNRAPVWLQEGLAKSMEGWWRGERGAVLPAHHQSMLARALATGDFVPFEKFARSMAYLDSGDEAALAFAQVSTMIEFLLSRGGPEALPKLMDKVRGGQDSFEATAELAGYATFEEFRQAWMEWLRTLPLIEEQLAALPVVLQGQGDEFASDPLLSEKPELARYARVGDLLREAGRPRAALVEYAKAEDPEGPPSPLLIVRRALCHEALGEKEQALRQVEEGARLYPEFSTLQVVRGRLLDGAGRREEALGAWRAAHDVNPYDPEVQRALVSGYQAAGKLEQAQRHLRYSRILATGGAIAPSAQSSAQ